MRLNKVIIRNFKRFDEEVTFNLPHEHVVVAGPNNTGKTTLLQAMMTWNVAFSQWIEGTDTAPDKWNDEKVPIARQTLFAVPLNNVDMLWFGANPDKQSKIEICLVFEGEPFPMEIFYDSTEQIYVRPKPNKTSEPHNWGALLAFLNIVYIPAISGITMAEPLYQMPKIYELLGQGRSGDVLRNLMVKAHSKQPQWDFLCNKIKELFGFTLLSPDSAGANIRAEYIDNNGARLDVSCAGSGFLQVLMLFAFLSSRKGDILLLDEPDAHLHILLQDRIFGALKQFAGMNNCTLIIATHSERIINTVEPHHLCVLLDKPYPIVDEVGREAVITAIKKIENTDIMLAKQKQGILYVEGHTDIAILTAWARVLGHRLLRFLEEPFWKPTNIEGSDTVSHKKHYEALCFVMADIKAVELTDSDGRDKHTALTPYADSNLHHFSWSRYEIESYLLHPQRLAVFATDKTGQKEAGEAVLSYLKDNLPPKIFRELLTDKEEVKDYLKITKAKEVIKKALQAGGLHNFSDMSQIAAAMLPDEIHPEVIEKLNAIADHLGMTDN